jgi:predicted dehydrogenase
LPGKLPVAVVGVGYLGRFHAQKYASLPECDLVAVVDADPARAAEVAAEVSAEALSSLDPILPRVRAVSVAVPTAQHHAVTKRCLEAGLHVLVEKPLAATSAEARDLVELARRQGLTLQVGYLERFNPAFVALAHRVGEPRFIEAIRIAGFRERGIDVDVVLDLMSHDLDLVLGMVRSPVADLHAVGISVLTPHTDLANARLIFANGCVANLTASRISAKSERRLRIFQREAYLSLDLAAPSARMYSLSRQATNPAEAFREESPVVEKGDALLAEVTAFVRSVQDGTPPRVSGSDGLAVMELCERISADIARNRAP